MDGVTLEMGDPLTTAMLWIGGLLVLGLLVVAVLFATGLVLRLARGVLRFVFGSFLRFVLVAGAIAVAVWTGLLDPSSVGTFALWAGGTVLVAGVIWTWATTTSEPASSPTEDPGGYICPNCGIGAHNAFSCPHAP